MSDIPQIEKPLKRVAKAKLALGRRYTVAALPRAAAQSTAPRDPVRTKARILKVAAKEFAERGFDGARVDEIVRRCKVSKNLIYHYFKSKDALFVAVLEDAYALLRTRQNAMALIESDPVSSIRKLIVDSFSHWSNSKDFINYLNSENFHKAKHIKKSLAIKAVYPSLIENLTRVLRKGEAEGVFRSGVDPIHLYISISALAYHFFSNQHTFSVIFDQDFTSKGMLMRRLSHVEDVVLGYLQSKPAA